MTAASGNGKLAMKRGRPSSKDALQILKAILVTARDLFVTEGFEGVSMERVAADTGITRVTLYNRYPTKAALFQAVVRDMLVDRFAQGDSLVQDAGGSLATTLRRRVTGMANILADPVFRAFHRLILSNRHRFPELGPMMHDVGYRRAVDLLVDDIKAAAVRDAVPVRRPDLIAEYILTAIHGWYLQYDLVRDLDAAEIEAYGWGIVAQLLLSREAW